MNVNPGSCSTFDLFDRKQIKFGAFITFKYILNLMTITTLIQNPRSYHVKPQVPKDIIDQIIGDVLDNDI